KDAELATALTRAYNRWLAEFCSEDPKRLKGAAHINLLDPVAAAAEARRTRDDGFVSVMLSSHPAARGNRMINDPALDVFWATLQDIDMPMAFHVVVNRPEVDTVNRWLAGDGDMATVLGNIFPERTFNYELGIMLFTLLSVDVEMAFAQM